MPITTLLNNLRNYACVFCVFSDDFRLFLDDSSGESGASDDETGTAGPPGQFTVMNKLFL